MLHVDHALERLSQKDPSLNPWLGEVRMHLDRYNNCRWALGADQPLKDFANGYLYYGFHRTEDGWVFREWLPGADAAWLYGDFNGWNRYEYPLTSIGNGDWELKLSGRDALRHGQHVKLIVGRQGIDFERIPAYISRCEMDERDMRLCGQIWEPDEPFAWTDDDFHGKQRPKTPMIYEAHIGMAQEKDGVGTYREFADKTLDWVRYAGYNTIQLMAIMEHPYYGSFGYQVTNFFAPSSRFGTPEDLKYLVNKAHSMGIAVLLDVVHSHACPNMGEGLNMQDGTEDQYFLYGVRGWHPAWQTKLFDYGKREVLHFLLSNLKYWMDEFHFDGFRFDGVTSMMYEDHGLGTAYMGYRQYFSPNTNIDARIYLMLANELVHGISDKAITIAEDMSGFPGMCLPLEYAGVGFDYRLNMGMPDLWIRLVKEQRQEDWDMGRIWNELTGGRPGEKAIGYVESHDQCLVGDQTLLFRMAGAEMYGGMGKTYHTPSMDRAIDMHKVIRFVTCTLASDGYLNFIGNEFGHPEWVDFPREGNNWSYQHAQRRWSLCFDWNLKYEWLANFDRAMTYFVNTNELHCSGSAHALWIGQAQKVLLYERSGFLFAVNMHPTWSQEGVFLSTERTGPGGYRVIFSSDEWPFGGQERISKNTVYHSADTEFGHGLRIYLPCRTACVLKKVEW